ncbi:MAG: helix-turn-helix transcriptional regulator [Dinghuibacter sp.]|nr:helix-turn-helix transcriptional regulator [Dinghuibacter sp.]
MKPIVHLKSISDINRFIQCTTQHPLVAVVDFSRVDEYIEEGTRISSDFYSVMFKNYCINHMRYGRQAYDFQEGSLICIAPKQVIAMDNEIEKRDDMMGWGLFFHPDLLRGTTLGSNIGKYSFFSYEVSEALHLSDKEKQVLYDCVQKIETELQENIDSHSQTLIVSNIELLLNYCSRYYGRQFITRKNNNSTVVMQVEKLLKQYFSAGNIQETGLPTVKFLAENVHLSAGYLSDLLKKETGMNAQDHIHYHLVEAAKNSLLNTNSPVSEIAYSLGFEYPQYFSKLFKQKTGKTPVAYRNQN